MSCRSRALAVAFTPVLAVACGQGVAAPTAPAAAQIAPTTGAQRVPSAVSSAEAEQPPFNLEAILRGDGFGVVKFRQVKDPTSNIIDLDVSVRDLQPETTYIFQRAVDTQLDDVCTGTNWLTLGQGPTPEPFVTDVAGSASVSLWRDLSTLVPGTAFDIDFRVVDTATGHVALQSDCQRFVVRD